MSHFPILKYQDSQNFKEQQIAKLYEELLELKESNHMSLNEIEECLDIIQICISIIVRHSRDNILKMFKFHRQKLCVRGWKCLGKVLFTIKKD
jgi:predicted house-cleaning noncanonical NTP pyrophosphatase (MazG superfamily)